MKLDWRQVTLYVTAMGMEGCWLYALMVMLNKQVAEGRLSIIGLLLLYPVAFGFNMLLQRLRWPKICLRSISWLAWVVGMLLIVKAQLFSGLALSDMAWLLAVPRAITEVIYTFKPELLILLSTAFLWWLGKRLACLRVNFTALVSEFQFGLAILVITFLVTALLEINLATSVPTVLLFFLFALLGISLAHALEGTSWLSGLYQGHWSGLLLVSISLILILGLIVGSVITPDLLQLFWAAVKWVWGLIMKALVFLASLFPDSEPAELPPAMPMPEIEPDGGFKLWTMPEAVRSGLRIGLYVLWSGLVLVALWRVSSQIFSWLRRKLAGMGGAEYETLPGAFRADVLGFLKRILSYLLRLRLPFLARGKLRSVLPEVASVRQLYRQLLRWAAAGGYPRQISQTPHEYLYTLVDLLPEAREDLVFITQQYVTARYSALVVVEDELHQLRQSWHRVKQNRIKRKSSEPNRG